MKRLFNFLSGLAFLGAVLSAVAYLLHKRGVLRVQVNYDNKEGQPVTRELDEIVDSAVTDAGERVTNKVSEVASDVKSTIARQLEVVNGQLGRGAAVANGGDLYEEE